MSGYYSVFFVCLFCLKLFVGYKMKAESRIFAYESQTASGGTSKSFTCERDVIYCCCLVIEEFLSSCPKLCYNNLKTLHKMLVMWLSQYHNFT